jgi:hypothetical protein
MFIPDTVRASAEPPDQRSNQQYRERAQQSRSYEESDARFIRASRKAHRASGCQLRNEQDRRRNRRHKSELHPDHRYTMK